jgi:TIR domain
MMFISPIVTIDDPTALPVPDALSPFFGASHCLIFITELTEGSLGGDLVVAGYEATAAFFYAGIIPHGYNGRRIRWYELARHHSGCIIQSGKWWARWREVKRLRQRAFEPLSTAFHFDTRTGMGAFGFHKTGIFQLRIEAPDRPGLFHVIIDALTEAELDILASHSRSTARDTALLTLTCGTIKIATPDGLRESLSAALGGNITSIQVEGDAQTSEALLARRELFGTSASVFISYSHSDVEFTLRLHNFLTRKGVRCWLDNHELLPGDKLHETIRRGILNHDKFLLICSRDSLQSWWVNNELEEIFAKERAMGTALLVPIAIDEAVWSDPPLNDKCIQIRSRYVGDFTRWTVARKFRSSAQKLLSALQQ